MITKDLTRAVALMIQLFVLLIHQQKSTVNPCNWGFLLAEMAVPNTLRKQGC